MFSSENFTNIAWDSAGVTTGPVTVPFVLSIGIGFSTAKNAQEGFGILTCASVAPIITVLLTDQMRVIYMKAVNTFIQRRQSRMRSVGIQCETQCETQCESIAQDSSTQVSERKETERNEHAHPVPFDYLSVILSLVCACII